MFAPKKQVVPLLLIIVLLLAGCGGVSEESPTVQPTEQAEPLEQVAAREWITAVTGLDGTQILKYTCLAQRENIQEFSAWTSALPILGSMFTGQTVGIKTDTSDLKFETLSKNDSSAQIQVTGELRMAVAAIGEATQLDEQWLMVYESETWRWCGAFRSKLSLPITDRPARVLPSPTPVISSQSESTKSLIGDQKLAQSIVGLWQIVQTGDESGYYTFLEDGRFIGSFGETGNYRVLDEATLEIRVDDNVGSINIRDVQSDTLSIAIEGNDYTLTRVPPVRNLATAIVGLWEFNTEFDKLTMMDFTPHGELLEWEFGRYQVLGSNTIEVEFSSGDEKAYLSILMLDGDVLMMSSVPDAVAERVAELTADLSQELIGVWQLVMSHGSDVPSGAVSYEFTKDGHANFANHLSGETAVANYEVFSNHTVIVESGADMMVWRIMDISDSSLIMCEWGDCDGSDKLEFERTQP